MFTTRDIRATEIHRPRTGNEDVQHQRMVGHGVLLKAGLHPGFDRIFPSHEGLYEDFNAKVALRRQQSPLLS